VDRLTARSYFLNAEPVSVTHTSTWAALKVKNSARVNVLFSDAPDETAAEIEWDAEIEVAFAKDAAIEERCAGAAEREEDFAGAAAIVGTKDVALVDTDDLLSKTVSLRPFAPSAVFQIRVFTAP
jgi:hypothetical protein